VTLPEERDDPDRRPGAFAGRRHRASLSRPRAAQAVHVCPVVLPLLLPPRNGWAGGARSLRPRRSTGRSTYRRAQGHLGAILAGGGPLVLSARRLGAMMERLAQIAHVKVVRIHTRVPVADPDRVDAALLAAIKARGKTTYLAVHANHPRELSGGRSGGCAGSARRGSCCSSQSVLLRGVNDRSRCWPT